MNIIGIVAEYNPFHMGHQHHISRSRELAGEDSLVICAMSGDYVQRGEPAVFSKFARAEAACRSGADLVVELPVQWSLSSAEGFAAGAVGLLAAMGITHLSFGSELGELQPLSELARLLLTEDIYNRIKELQKADAALSFAAARQLAAAERLGDAAAALLEKPNNILGVEYLKAIGRLGADIKPVTVRRIGSGHDEKGSEGPRSASELRELLYRGEDYTAFLPDTAAEVFRREAEAGRILDRERFELAVLSRLLTLPAEAFDRLPDAAGGLGARIYKAVHESMSLEQLYQNAKTKRYALSRVRRAVLCAALGIEKGAASMPVPYVRVLAANEKGCAQLRRLSESCSLPIITKAAHIKAMSPQCTDIFSLNSSAHDLFLLSNQYKTVKICGQDWRTGPCIVKNQ